MNKTFGKIIIVVLLFCGTMHLSAQDNKVMYSINGKAITYYALSRDSVMSMEVS